MIKCTLAVLLGLLAYSSAIADQSSPQPQRIPFKLESRLPTVQAEVSGKPASLFLDLGAYKPIALTHAALDKLPVAYTGQTETFRDSTGQMFTNRVFDVNALVAGTFKATGLEGVEFSYSKGAGAFSQDGYIGFGLLMRYFLVFDYIKYELRLYSPGTSIDKLRSECGVGDGFKIDIINGVVEAKVDTEKGKFVFQLDTGSSENVLRPSAVGLPIDTKQMSYAFSKFDFGGKNLGRTRFPLREFAAPDVDGVLGTDFFDSRVVCFDFSSQRGWIK